MNIKIYAIFLADDATVTKSLINFTQGLKKQ